MSDCSVPEREISTVTSTRRNLAYPSPFFDIGQHYIPRNIKEVFKWTKYHYISNSIVYPIVHKMAEYSVTGLTYSTTNESLESLLEQTIKIRSFLCSVHEDVMVYGNAFAIMHYPFVRYLKYKDKSFKASDIDYKIRFNSNEWEFYGILPGSKLKQEVVYTHEDIYVSNKNMFRLSKIDPLNIDIEYNSFNGERTYYYNIPNEDKKRIRSSKKVMLDTTPSIIFDAVAQNKNIILDKHFFYHFERPSIAGLWPGWGTPSLVPVLKDIHYWSVMRKANEALALQHIVPLNVLFPMSNADVSPYQTINLDSWKKKLEEELLKWRRDQNYIPIMPIPVGTSQIGGQGKAFMVTQEADFVAKGIAAALGVPIEMIQGGMSWSGSSISLRVLENTFIKQREEDLEFINNFLVPRISKYFKIPKQTIGLKTFKMADDVQFQQIMVNLMQNGFMSRKRILDNFDVQYDEEIEQMKKEHAELSQIQFNDTLAEGEAASRAQFIQMRESVKAEHEIAKLRKELANEQIQTENSNINTTMSAIDVAQKYASQLMSMPPESANQFLMEMREKSPNLFKVVIQEMKNMQVQARSEPQQQPQQQQQQEAPPQIQGVKPKKLPPVGGKQNGNMDKDQPESEPLPEKRPPRRKNSPV